jgi:hypothetical protein
MSSDVSLAELIALAIVMIMLVAVIAAPTASIAATLQPHAYGSTSHHHRITASAYGFAPERNRIPGSGYGWGNPDRGPWPQECGGGSC